VLADQSDADQQPRISRGERHGAPSWPIRATIVIGGEPVTILPRRAPVGNSEPIRGRTLTIVPDAPPPTAPSSIGTVPLEGDRDQFSATLEPGGLPARAVLDLTDVEAATLGRAAGLDQVLFWDGRRARLLDCR
jgi:hypothetical protein